MFEPVTDASSERANIVIDEVVPEYGHLPYVMHPGGCGEPAEYIQLTWQYMANRTLALKYGDIGRAIYQYLH